MRNTSLCGIILRYPIMAYAKCGSIKNGTKIIQSYTIGIIVYVFAGTELLYNYTH